MYESKDKMVSHPDHYQSANGLEVIDCIEAFTHGLDGIEATDTGNIIKYACRWKKKNGIQDLEKILWYTQHLIDHLRDKEAEVESDRISEDSIPTIEEFKKWFYDTLQKQGYVMEADICAHAHNCKAFDKKEDK